MTPPAFEPAAFAPLLARVLDAGDVAALRLRMPGAEPEVVKRAVEAIIRPVQDRGTALLLHGDAALARRLGCDGVHVPPREVGPARAVFGERGSVGAGCGRSIDAAMSAAEAGADYVAFGPCDGDAPVDRERIADWALSMVVPCVVGGGLTTATIGSWAATGAEFLSLGRSVWDAPDGPDSAITALIQTVRNSPRIG